MRKLLFALLISMAVDTVFGQNCNEVLKFKNEVKIHNTGNSISDIHNWLNTELSSSTKSKYGGGIDLVIPQIKLPLSASGGTENAEIVKNAIASGNKAVFSTQFVNDVYSKILTPESYAAWIKCNEGVVAIRMAEIAALKDERFFEGIITNKIPGAFILKLRWKPIGDQTRATVTDVAVKGASYNKNLLKAGLRIGTEFITIPFYTNEPTVTIAINTDNQGSFGITVGAPKENIYSGRADFENDEIREVIDATNNSHYKVKYIGVNPTIELKKDANNEKIIAGSIKDSFKMILFDNDDPRSSKPDLPDLSGNALPDLSDKNNSADVTEVYTFTYYAIFKNITTERRRSGENNTYNFEIQTMTVEVSKNGRTTKLQNTPDSHIEIFRLKEDGENLSGTVTISIGNKAEIDGQFTLQKAI